MSTDTDKVNLTYILECIGNVEELTAPGRSTFEAAKNMIALRFSTIFRRWRKALNGSLNL